VEQELLTLPEHLSSPTVFSGVRITRSLVLCVCFVDRCLTFCPFSFGHCVVRSSVSRLMITVVKDFIQKQIYVFVLFFLVLGILCCLFLCVLFFLVLGILCCLFLCVLFVLVLGILCCLFLCVFLSLGYPMLSVCLDCPFGILWYLTMTSLNKSSGLLEAVGR
jgi:hypothetical protein